MPFFKCSVLLLGGVICVVALPIGERSTLSIPTTALQPRSLETESDAKLEFPQCPPQQSGVTQRPFNFVEVNAYLQNIIANCSSKDSRLVDPFGYPGEAFLTATAVKQWLGEKLSSWHAYPGNDILKRLLTWKLPLLSLFSLFGKQPLRKWREMSTISHLIGCPIDTLASIFYTLHVCCLRVRLLKRAGLNSRDWKAVALVMQAFDECSGNQFAMLDIENKYFPASNPLLSSFLKQS
jgi:hypothetical protein